MEPLILKLRVLLLFIVYQLQINLLKQECLKTILVVGAEAQTNLIDKYTDRATCIIFGDGAGAAIIQNSNDQSQILSTHLHCEGI